MIAASAPTNALLARDARGGSLTEYILVIGMAAVLVVASVRAFGKSAGAKAERQGECVAALDPGCARTVATSAAGRHAVVETAPTASAASGATAAKTHGSTLLARASEARRTLAAAAQAAPPPPPTPAAADGDAQRIADAILATLRRQFPYGEIGQQHSPLWPRSWVQQRDMWGESWGNELPSPLVQSPPASHWGRRSAEMTHADTCEGAACRDEIERDFGMRRCESQGDCTRGACAPVAAASQGAPVSLCTGHSDFLYDEVYNAIVAAQRTVTFSTLAAPDGAYAAAIRNALGQLHRQQAPGAPGVDVRILVGRADDGVDEHGAPNPPGTGVREILAVLTRDLPADSPVRVSVGTYGGPDVSSFASWSHAKMIVADGREALVGGHNWWVGDYNRDNPVHDVSMRLRGPAARHAEAYFDRLWSYAVTSGRFATRGGPGGVAHGARTGSPAAQPGTGVRVITVGAPGGSTVNVTAYAPSDAALMAMMRAARSSIRLSQQELVSQPLAPLAIDQLDRSTKDQPAWLQRLLRSMGRRAAESALEQHIAPALLDELALALMRGVRVEIVLTGSDPTSGTQGYSHGWTAEQTREAIAAHARANFVRLSRSLPTGTRPDAAEVARLVASNLDVRELRFSDEAALPVDGSPTPMPLRNHAKVVIVDDAAAYVGSQNLYPGGIAGNPPIQQLGELGFILVGRSAVEQQLLTDYWNRMWPLASRTSTRRPGG